MRYGRGHNQKWIMTFSLSSTLNGQGGRRAVIQAPRVGARR
jgi:hypothetical protein